MTQEEKSLLLKDLCARLPYYPWLYSNVAEGNWAILTPVVISGLMSATDELVIKPYLRPMSSMTEEEKEEYRKVCELDTKILSKHPMDGTPFPALYNSQDWLNANHFDYRGLIAKKLALKASKYMYHF